ncbi:BrnA antitoxin family protein [Methylomonas sp. MgM2]
MQVKSKSGRLFRLNNDREEAAVNAGIQADPDTYEPDDAEFTEFKPSRGRPVAESRKVPISIRLSPEVVDAFKATGRGWQSRLDDALKEWLKDHAA